MLEIGMAMGKKQKDPPKQVYAWSAGMGGLPTDLIVVPRSSR